MFPFDFQVSVVQRMTAAVADRTEVRSDGEQRLIRYTPLLTISYFVVKVKCFVLR